jgi:ribosomal protein L2
MVDFARLKGGKQIVERIEHDPGRTAHIALVKNINDGTRSYILAAEGLRPGDVVESYRSGLPKSLIQEMGGQMDQGVIASKTAHKGNCLKLGMIPIGTPIFNIAPTRESIGKICRSAGTHGVIIGKGEDTVQKEMIKLIGDSGNTDMSSLTKDQLRKFEKAANYVTVRLSSGEVRLMDKEAVATVGVASNINFKYTSLGKAGRARWLGIRPTVRGLAMNAADHPHGGGRGKSKGDRIPVSPWGIPVCCDSPLLFELRSLTHATGQIRLQDQIEEQGQCSCCHRAAKKPG